MIQTKIENMNNYPPFLVTKEKRNSFLIQGANKSKISNISLSNINIIKINSCNNLDPKSKDKIIEPIKEVKGVQFNMGRWTKEEHNKFLKGIIEYGNNWKMIEQLIRTRSSSQARSHAQKYFVKVKKKIISQNKIFNARNLLNYVFNCIKNFKGGQPLDAIQKKRTLNLLISNFQNFRKDEIESCNMVVNEIKSISSQKDGEKYTIFEKENDKNRNSDNHNLIIEIKEDNYSKINYDFEGNKLEFCNKKRKYSLFTNKIFKINKVTKYKYSNKVNEINENWNKKVSDRSNNFISNNNISNNKDNNINNKININTNDNNIKSFISNNFKNNNDFTCFEMNKINSSEPLFDFDLNIREKNNYNEDEYPKYNTLESKKLFFNGSELNDSFKNNFFEESILSLGEHLDENSFINKLCDLFD